MVMITGVGGTGQAIARRQGTGTHMLAADFNPHWLEAVTGRLGGEGYGVTPAVVDAPSRESVAALAEHAASLGEVRASWISSATRASPTPVVAAAGISAELHVHRVARTDSTA
ncbi:hypothetical protein [Nonomuraea sp. NPDC050202]|uniref:hypothetical protein n=1 Tax=Nonomuraea sp. NPDC050202 TaxID=3155035 RepID=UPI0033E9287A